MAGGGGGEGSTPGKCSEITPHFLQSEAFCDRFHNSFKRHIPRIF